MIINELTFQELSMFALLFYPQISNFYHEEEKETVMEFQSVSMSMKKNIKYNSFCINAAA